MDGEDGIMAVMNELCCGPWMGMLAKAYRQATKDMQEAAGPPAVNIQQYNQVSLVVCVSFSENVDSI